MLIILTFIGFPQWRFTQKLTGAEPEVVRYYTVSKCFAGKRISIDVVPRTLNHKLIPTIIIFVGIGVELLGIACYLLCRSQS